MDRSGITRQMKDLQRLRVIQAVLDRELKPGQAAEKLGITVRQIERLLIRYRAEGPIGLVSRHRHRSGNRALNPSVAEKVVTILRTIIRTSALRSRLRSFGSAMASRSPKRQCVAYKLLRDYGFHVDLGLRKFNSRELGERASES